MIDTLAEFLDMEAQERCFDDRVISMGLALYIRPSFRLVRGVL